MAVRTIVTGENNPVLRKAGARVERVTKDVLRLLRDMEDTVRHADGLGLAAPQIGISLQVCIVRLGERMVPLINPEIIGKSQEKESAEEGCLSLPDIWIQVERPAGITVRYVDTKGAEQERALQGMDARVVQHEIDHLNGVLIVDYR